jgi:5'-nucleotidase
LVRHAHVRLLLTNDDGIDSHFLHCLANALSSAGHEIAVAAPRHEQSWIGTAKSRHRPVNSAATDKGLNCLTWSIDGTPGDCVAIALSHLLPDSGWGRPDAVVSGINVGFNVSLGFILASGTIGGAWEGAVQGLPALAFSQELSPTEFEAWHASDQTPSPSLRNTLDHSAAHAAQLTPQLLQTCPAAGWVVHNVNFPFPCVASSQVRRTIPARVQVAGLFGPADEQGNHHFAFNRGEDQSPPDALTDRAAIATGHISHTILDYKTLGHPAIEQ